jgi:anthranilate synthase/aminodeoxychorismate synthase-like glutamine amidotransferase
MRVLLLDNQDSFTWNLAQALSVLGARVEVEASDSLSLTRVRDGTFDALVVSPGPGRPERAGRSVEAVREAPRTMPVLGVCLGHQAAAVAFGGRVVHAPRPVHGKTSAVRHDGTGVFRGLPSPFVATRYHSLCVEPRSLPDSLLATAWSDDGVLMGLRHRTLPLEGVQFHPESILTGWGERLLGNFLETAGALARGRTTA